MGCGIDSIGKTNPDRRIAGSRKRNVESIACCCVIEIVEMYTPMPRLAAV